VATASANDVVFGGVVAGRALGSILLEVVSRARGGDTQGVWLKWEGALWQHGPQKITVSVSARPGNEINKMYRSTCCT
jgi:hypothetical protein